VTSDREHPAVALVLKLGRVARRAPHFTTRTVHVRRTVVEVSRKHSPTGERTFIKHYPKDDEPRLVPIEAAICRLLREHLVV